LRCNRQTVQRGEPGRTDGVALGHRLGGVAHRVERIGDVAHPAIELRHLGDAAGVVGDRAIGVQRDDHAVSDSIAVAATAMP